MKQYLLTILIIITLFIFSFSIFPIKESADTTSNVPDSSQIIINSSESLRDFLGKMYYISNQNENDIINNIKSTVCFKINKLSSYLAPIANLLDNKTEDEIMEIYGPEKQEEIMGSKVGPKPPLPIIGSNYDYYTLILLCTYIKMLKPYQDLNIWQQNVSDNAVLNISSICNNQDDESVQLVNCARNLLDDIRKILSYFQYQSDTSNVVAYGDGADTGTGNVPRE